MSVLDTIKGWFSKSETKKETPAPKSGVDEVMDDLTYSTKAELTPEKIKEMEGKFTPWQAPEETFRSYGAVDMIGSFFKDTLWRDLIKGGLVGGGSARLEKSVSAEETFKGRKDELDFLKGKPVTGLGPFNQLVTTVKGVWGRTNVAKADEITERLSLGTTSEVFSGGRDMTIEDKIIAAGEFLSELDEMYKSGEYNNEEIKKMIGKVKDEIAFDYERAFQDFHMIKKGYNFKDNRTDVFSLIRVKRDYENEIEKHTFSKKQMEKVQKATEAKREYNIKTFGKDPHETKDSSIKKEIHKYVDDHLKPYLNEVLNERHNDEYRGNLYYEGRNISVMQLDEAASVLLEELMKEVDYYNEIFYDTEDLESKYGQKVMTDARTIMETVFVEGINLNIDYIKFFVKHIGKPGYQSEKEISRAREKETGNLIQDIHHLDFNMVNGGMTRRDVIKTTFDLASFTSIPSAMGAVIESEVNYMLNNLDDPKIIASTILLRAPSAFFGEVYKGVISTAGSVLNLFRVGVEKALAPIKNKFPWISGNRKRVRTELRNIGSATPTLKKSVDVMMDQSTFVIAGIAEFMLTRSLHGANIRGITAAGKASTAAKLAKHKGLMKEAAKLNKIKDARGLQARIDGAKKTISDVKDFQTAANNAFMLTLVDQTVVIPAIFQSARMGAYKDEDMLLDILFGVTLDVFDSIMASKRVLGLGKFDSLHDYINNDAFIDELSKHLFKDLEYRKGVNKSAKSGSEIRWRDDLTDEEKNILRAQTKGYMDFMSVELANLKDTVDPRSFDEIKRTITSLTKNADPEMVEDMAYFGKSSFQLELEKYQELEKLKKSKEFERLTVDKKQEEIAASKGVTVNEDGSITYLGRTKKDEFSINRGRQPTVDEPYKEATTYEYFLNFAVNKEAKESVQDITRMEILGSQYDIRVNEWKTVGKKTQSQFASIDIFDPVTGKYVHSGIGFYIPPGMQDSINLGFSSQEVIEKIFKRPVNIEYQSKGYFEGNFSFTVTPKRKSLSETVEAFANINPSNETMNALVENVKKIWDERSATSSSRVNKIKTKIKNLFKKDKLDLVPEKVSKALAEGDATVLQKAAHTETVEEFRRMILKPANEEERLVSGLFFKSSVDEDKMAKLVQPGTPDPNLGRVYREGEINMKVVAGEASDTKPKVIVEANPSAENPNIMEVKLEDYPLKHSVEDTYRAGQTMKEDFLELGMTDLGDFDKIVKRIDEYKLLEAGLEDELREVYGELKDKLIYNVVFNDHPNMIGFDTLTIGGKEYKIKIKPVKVSETSKIAKMQQGMEDLKKRFTLGSAEKSVATTPQTTKRGSYTVDIEGIDGVINLKQSVPVTEKSKQMTKWNMTIRKGNVEDLFGKKALSTKKAKESIENIEVKLSDTKTKSYVNKSQSYLEIKVDEEKGVSAAKRGIEATVKMNKLLFKIDKLTRKLDIAYNNMQKDWNKFLKKFPDARGFSRDTLDSMSKEINASLGQIRKDHSDLVDITNSIRFRNQDVVILEETTKLVSNKLKKTVADMGIKVEGKVVEQIDQVAEFFVLYRNDPEKILSHIGAIYGLDHRIKNYLLDTFHGDNFWRREMPKKGITRKSLDRDLKKLFKEVKDADKHPNMAELFGKMTQEQFNKSVELYNSGNYKDIHDFIKKIEAMGIKMHDISHNVVEAAFESVSDIKIVRNRRGIISDRTIRDLHYDLFRERIRKGAFTEMGKQEMREAFKKVMENVRSFEANEELMKLYRRFQSLKTNEEKAAFLATARYSSEGVYGGGGRIGRAGNFRQDLINYKRELDDLRSLTESSYGKFNYADVLRERELGEKGIATFALEAKLNRLGLILDLGDDFRRANVHDKLYEVIGKVVNQGGADVTEEHFKQLATINNIVGDMLPADIRQNLKRTFDLSTLGKTDEDIVMKQLRDELKSLSLDDEIKLLDEQIKEGRKVLGLVEGELADVNKYLGGYSNRYARAVLPQVKDYIGDLYFEHASMFRKAINDNIMLSNGKSLKDYLTTDNRRYRNILRETRKADDFIDDLVNYMNKKTINPIRGGDQEYLNVLKEVEAGIKGLHEDVLNNLAPHYGDTFVASLKKKMLNIDKAHIEAISDVFEHGDWMEYIRFTDFEFFERLSIDHNLANTIWGAPIADMKALAKHNKKIVREEAKRTASMKKVLEEFKNASEKEKILNKVGVKTDGIINIDGKETRLYRVDPNYKAGDEIYDDNFMKEFISESETRAAKNPHNQYYAESEYVVPMGRNSDMSVAMFNKFMFGKSEKNKAKITVPPVHIHKKSKTLLFDDNRFFLRKAGVSKITGKPKYHLGVKGKSIRDHYKIVRDSFGLDIYPTFHKTKGGKYIITFPDAGSNGKKIDGIYGVDKYSKRTQNVPEFTMVPKSEQGAMLNVSMASAAIGKELPKALNASMSARGAMFSKTSELMGKFINALGLKAGQKKQREGLIKRAIEEGDVSHIMLEISGLLRKSKDGYYGLFRGYSKERADSLKRILKMMMEPHEKVIRSSSITIESATDTLKNIDLDPSSLKDIPNPQKFLKTLESIIHQATFQHEQALRSFNSIKMLYDGFEGAGTAIKQVYDKLPEQLKNMFALQITTDFGSRYMGHFDLVDTVSFHQLLRMYQPGYYVPSKKLINALEAVKEKNPKFKSIKNTMELYRLAKKDDKIIDHVVKELKDMGVKTNKEDFVEILNWVWGKPSQETLDYIKHLTTQEGSFYGKVYEDFIRVIDETYKEMGNIIEGSGFGKFKVTINLEGLRRGANVDDYVNTMFHEISHMMQLAAKGDSAVIVKDIENILGYLYDNKLLPDEITDFLKMYDKHVDRELFSETGGYILNKIITGKDPKLLKHLSDIDINKLKGLKNFKRDASKNILENLTELFKRFIEEGMMLVGKKYNANYLKELEDLYGKLLKSDNFHDSYFFLNKGMGEHLGLEKGIDGLYDLSSLKVTKENFDKFMSLDKIDYVKGLERKSGDAAKSSTKESTFVPPEHPYSNLYNKKRIWAMNTLSHNNVTDNQLKTIKSFMNMILGSKGRDTIRKLGSGNMKHILGFVRLPWYVLSQTVFKPAQGFMLLLLNAQGTIVDPMVDAAHMFNPQDLLAVRKRYNFLIEAGELQQAKGGPLRQYLDGELESVADLAKGIGKRGTEIATDSTKLGWYNAYEITFDPTFRNNAISKAIVDETGTMNLKEFDEFMKKLPKKDQDKIIARIERRAEDLYLLRTGNSLHSSEGKFIYGDPYSLRGMMKKTGGRAYHFLSARGNTHVRNYFRLMKNGTRKLDEIYVDLVAKHGRQEANVLIKDMMNKNQDIMVFVQKAIAAISIGEKMARNDQRSSRDPRYGRDIRDVIDFGLSFFAPAQGFMSSAIGRQFANAIKATLMDMHYEGVEVDKGMAMLLSSVETMMNSMGRRFLILNSLAGAKGKMDILKETGMAPETFYGRGIEFIKSFLSNLDVFTRGYTQFISDEVVNKGYKTRLPTTSTMDLDLIQPDVADFKEEYWRMTTLNRIKYLQEDYKERGPDAIWTWMQYKRPFMKRYKRGAMSAGATGLDEVMTAYNRTEESNMLRNGKLPWDMVDDEFVDVVFNHLTRGNLMTGYKPKELEDGTAVSRWTADMKKLYINKYGNTIREQQNQEDVFFKYMREMLEEGQLDAYVKEFNRTDHDGIKAGLRFLATVDSTFNGVVPGASYQIIAGLTNDLFREQYNKERYKAGYKYGEESDERKEKASGIIREALVTMFGETLYTSNVPYRSDISRYVASRVLPEHKNKFTAAEIDKDSVDEEGESLYYQKTYYGTKMAYETTNRKDSLSSQMRDAEIYTSLAIRNGVIDVPDIYNAMNTIIMAKNDKHMANPEIQDHLLHMFLALGEMFNDAPITEEARLNGHVGLAMAFQPLYSIIVNNPKVEEVYDKETIDKVADFFRGTLDDVNGIEMDRLKSMEVNKVFDKLSNWEWDGPKDKPTGTLMDKYKKNPTSTYGNSSGYSYNKPYIDRFRYNMQQLAGNRPYGTKTVGSGGSYYNKDLSAYFYYRYFFKDAKSRGVAVAGKDRVTRMFSTKRSTIKLPKPKSK